KLGAFGPVVEDGFGIRYITEKESIFFNITSWASMEDDLQQFVSHLRQSLSEMVALFKNK
ncbi:MAG: choline/carnitine O-acyltransferase, partial [bacterium]|nr:choline/carnitine O-acyltransferase [bacterium]